MSFQHPDAPRLKMKKTDKKLGPSNKNHAAFYHPSLPGSGDNHREQHHQHQRGPAGRTGIGS